MSKPLKVILIVAACIFLIILLALAGLLWLNAGEYKPQDRELVEVSPQISLIPARSVPIELLSWNIGYASLDASQDFFMDGGTGVRPATARNAEENIWAIKAFISSVIPDIVFLQEVDVNSKRSYGINQVAYFSETWMGSSAFAHNFKHPFIPVPFPNFIGRVESGLLTLNSYTSTAERISLPSSFEWPVRVFQLKRCLLVVRVPVQNSNAELVLVNLHLEAFDEGGEGRIAQTRALADFLKAEYAKGNYCVAGGDFNQIFPALQDVFPIIPNEFYTPGILDDTLFGEGWILAADPSAPTTRSLDKPYDGNRENHQFYIINGFILSPNVELISMQTIDLDFQNSDHNPVRLIFSLR